MQCVRFTLSNVASVAVTLINELLEVITLVSVEFTMSVVPKILSMFARTALSVVDA